MEDTIQEQEASRLPIPVLTQDDLSRIENCDFYSRAKEIIQSAIDYSEYEVGSAIFIKYKNSAKLISTDYEGKNPKKYLIVKNDKGFIFAKHILASGKPSASITCLTIDYGSHYYELQIDDDYIESMLLDVQDSYDPLASAKDLMRRKGKASRDNMKKRLLLNSNKEAYAFIKLVHIGDTFFTSDFSYGTGITEYKVTNITTRPAVPPSGSGWNRQRGDEDYYLSLGFSEVILLELSPISTTNKYSYNKTIEYRHISKEGSGYNDFVYQVRPIGPEDLAK